MDSDAMRERGAVTPNGGALAAVMAAGIGAFAMGVFVLANEAGIFAAPSLYGPSGGLSGRSTFAVATWLIAWAILNSRWRAQDVAPGRVLTWTLALAVLGVLMTFPPVWGLL